MKIKDMKLRLALRGICKYAKHLGIELEDVLGMVEEEWENA